MPAEAQPQVMAELDTIVQKWEYLTVYVDLPELLRQADEGRGTIQGLDDLGEMGWELVAVTGVDIRIGVRYHLFFKRPKVEDE